MSSSTRAKMKRKFSIVDYLADEPKHIPLTPEEIARSRAQAKTDGGLQAKMVAEREQRLKTVNE